MGDLPISSCEELELGVYNFHEELALRLWKQREFGQIGGLLHELPILQRDGDG